MSSQPAIIYSEQWEYVDLDLDCPECGCNTSRCECEEEE